MADTIKWYGGRCPIPHLHGSEFSAQTRDGCWLDTRGADAAHFRWSHSKDHDDPDDIVAYKIN